MAYEIYDLKGILFLVFAIPMIASTNIDCSGKAFHCVNSTHFIICVDLGGGVSTTIDDFVIPCPATTVCHEHNIFECEFPKIQATTIPFEVIGVSKESDLSVTTSVIHSVTVPTPPDKSLIVLNENTTVITVPTPEEGTSVKKLDVLESFKQPNENTTDTNETVDVQQINKNINRITSVIDNNKKIDSAVQTTTDKAVITLDKSKSIDMMATTTSIIKPNELISNDSLNLANTSDISFNSTPSVELLNTKRLMKHADVSKTVADEINTTPAVNTYIWNGSDGMNKIEDNNRKNSINKTIPERNSIGEISTTERVVPKKKYIEPLVEVLVDQTTTDRNLSPLGHPDLFLGHNVANPTTTTSDTFLNILHNNAATTEQYTTTKAILNGEKTKTVTGVKSDILCEISANTAANENVENNVTKQNELVHQNFVEQIPIVEVTGSEQIAERIMKHISPEKIETSVSAPETVVTSPQTTTDATLDNIVYSATTIVNNDTFLQNVTDAHSLEITIKTDLTIKFTDNSYQVNRESSKAFIATNNNVSGTNETIATLQSMYDNSRTNMFNDITTQLNTFLTATTMYPTTTLAPPQNKAIANGIGLKKAVPPATVATSISIKTFLNGNTTLGPYNATFNSVTNTTVKDWISQIDIFPTASVIRTSENYTFLDRSATTMNAIITNQGGKNVGETVIPNEILNIYQLNKTTQDEVANKTNTVYLRDISKQVIHNDSFNSIKTNNHVIPSPTVITNQEGKNVVETVIIHENSNINQLNKTTQDKDANKTNTVYLRDISKQGIHTDSFKPIKTNNHLTPSPTVITNQESKNVVETFILHENSNIYQLNKTSQDEVANKTNTVYLRDVSKQDILNNNFNTIKTNNNLIPLPSIYASKFTTPIPDTNYTKTISIDSISKVPKDNPEIIEKRFSANDYKVETSTRLPLDLTHYTNMGGGESYENILITNTPARESIAQEVATHQRMNTNITPIETSTDMVVASMISINAKKYDYTSNLKDSDNIETTNLGVDQNKIADIFDTIKSNNIIYSDRTTKLSSASSSNKNSSVKIASLIETTSPKYSLLNMSFKPSSLITKPLLNSTENNVTNISLSYGYIETNKPETSNVYTTLSNYNPSNKINQVTESENTQTTESLPKNNHMNLESSITATQASLIKEKHTENDKNPNSNGSPLRTVELNQSDPTTNSMNYVPVPKIVDFAPLKELNLTKWSSLPNIETNTTTSVNSFILDTITKTTAFIPNTTNTFRQQVVKNNLEQRKGLPVFSTVTETQINNDAIIKSLLPAFEPTRKNYMLSRVTSTPISVISSDVSKTSDLPISPLPTVNYNVPQSIIDTTTETVKKYVIAAGSMVDAIKGIGEKITETNNYANVSFDDNQNVINSNVHDKLVENKTNHEKIFMDNNTLQDNKLNITIIASKELVDSHKRILNFTENDKTPIKVNTESAQKIAFRINDSTFEGEVTSEPMGSETIHIQDKNLRTNPPLAIQIDHKYLKQAEFAVTTSPLYAIETGSVAPKYLTQSKPIRAYTDKLLQNNKTEVTGTTQDEVQTKSQNTSIKINNTNTNLNTLYSHLLPQNNIVNVSLEEHLTSQNYTITTEIQGHFNKSKGQTNKLKLDENSSRNSNMTRRSITLNLDNSTINDSASHFNCLNHTRGKYADKKDCRKFYTCVGKLQAIIGTCPNNTVFSEINKQCTRNLSHCVRNNQFRCLLDGRFSDFFLDNIYYICVKNSTNAFVRYKLQCQNGYHLNKVSVKCERNKNMPSQSSSASSVSENSRISKDESQLIINKEETKPIKSTTDFECNSEGKFPYTMDRRKYYVCTNVKNIYRRKIKKCASDEVYDDSKKNCIESESIEC